MRGYGGSNKSFSVERNPVREEQLLQPLLLIQRSLNPQVRRPRQNTFCEGEDALYVELIELHGVSVDLRERELLAQPVALPLVRVEVDRLRVDEGFIEAVELLLNRLRVALGLGSVAADRSLATTRFRTRGLGGEVAALGQRHPQRHPAIVGSAP